MAADGLASAEGKRGLESPRSENLLVVGKGPRTPSRIRILIFVLKHWSSVDQNPRLAGAPHDSGAAETFVPVGEPRAKCSSLLVVRSELLGQAALGRIAY
jgi:hypothetical protein